jgi:hypothetical protein
MTYYQSLTPVEQSLYNLLTVWRDYTHKQAAAEIERRRAK